MKDLGLFSGLGPFSLNDLSPDKYTPLHDPVFPPITNS